jgi:predicted negative regulator of RcsB-dependent stress response
MVLKVKGKAQKVKGKWQKAKSKWQKAKGKKQKANPAAVQMLFLPFAFCPLPFKNHSLSKK